MEAGLLPGVPWTGDHFPTIVSLPWDILWRAKIYKVVHTIVGILHAHVSLY